MSLTAAQRAETNRRNAAKSTGPKTDEGKARSRRNALTHGLRAEALALPNEDPAAVAARSDSWNDHYRPASPAAQHLVNACVAATLLSDRCQRYHHAALAKQVRDAESAWEADREDEVAALVVLLRTDPARAARELARTGHGCRWLIGRWESLIETLAAGACWTGPDCDEALRLQGLRPDAALYRTSPDVWLTRLLSVTCDPDPSRGALDWLFHANQLPELFYALYSRDALPSPDESRRRLLLLAEAELARARALEASHRVHRDDPDRAEAADRALILHDGPPARLFLRYHAEARTSFQRAYNSLVKTLERDAADPPNEADPAPPTPAEEASPNEASSAASPEVIETCVDSARPDPEPEPRAEADKAPRRRSRKPRGDFHEVGPILMRLLAEQDAAQGSQEAFVPLLPAILGESEGPVDAEPIRY